MILLSLLRAFFVVLGYALCLGVVELPLKEYALGFAVWLTVAAVTFVAALTEARLIAAFDTET